MENKFANFKLVGSKVGDIHCDVRLTSSYIAFSNKGLKKLGVSIDDRVLLATVKDKDQGQIILIAATDKTRGSYLIKLSKNVTAKPIVHTTLAKEDPKIRVDYHLIEYGKYEGLTWWRLITEDDLKILKVFNGKD